MSNSVEHVVIVLTMLFFITKCVLVAMLIRETKLRRIRLVRRFRLLAKRTQAVCFVAVPAAALLYSLELVLRTASERGLLLSLATFMLLVVAMPWVRAMNRSGIFFAALAFAGWRIFHHLLPPGSEGPAAMGAFLIMGLIVTLLGISLFLRLAVLFLQERAEPV